MVRRHRCAFQAAKESIAFGDVQAPTRRVLDLAKMIDSDTSVGACDPLGASGMCVQPSVSDFLLPPALPELVRCLSPMEYYFNPPSGSETLGLQLRVKVDDREHDGISTAASSNYDGSPRISCQKGHCIADENRAKKAQQAPYVPIEQVWRLATSPEGSRTVQDALEDTDNSLGIAIVSELRGHVWEAVNCQHANHVLQKCIMKLPPSACQFIIEELSRNPGSAKHLAKHCFGCRVFQRLLEHCLPDQLHGLVDDALGQTLGAVVALCRHHFGNYVVQSILEHGSCGQRRRVVAALVDQMPRVAAARHASAVLSKALCHSTCSSQDRASLARAMLQEPARLARIAKERFGHTAVQQLMRDAGGEEHAVRHVLAQHVPELNHSRYGRSIAKELAERACD